MRGKILGIKIITHKSLNMKGVMTHILVWYVTQMSQFKFSTIDKKEQMSNTTVSLYLF